MPGHPARKGQSFQQKVLKQPYVHLQEKLRPYLTPHAKITEHVWSTDLDGKQNTTKERRRKHTSLPSWVRRGLLDVKPEAQSIRGNRDNLGVIESTQLSISTDTISKRKAATGWGEIAVKHVTYKGLVSKT